MISVSLANEFSTEPRSVSRAVDQRVVPCERWAVDRVLASTERMRYEPSANLKSSLYGSRQLDFLFRPAYKHDSTQPSDASLQGETIRGMWSPSTMSSTFVGIWRLLDKEHPY